MLLRLVDGMVDGDAGEDDPPHADTSRPAASAKLAYLMCFPK
jgi:hypothetical protein